MHSIRTFGMMLALAALLLPVASAETTTIDLCRHLPENGPQPGSPIDQRNIESVWQELRHPQWSCELRGFNDPVDMLLRD